MQLFQQHNYLHRRRRATMQPRTPAARPAPTSSTFFPKLLTWTSASRSARKMRCRLETLSAGTSSLCSWAKRQLKAPRFAPRPRPTRSSGCRRRGPEESREGERLPGQKFNGQAHHHPRHNPHRRNPCCCLCRPGERFRKQKRGSVEVQGQQYGGSHHTSHTTHTIITTLTILG